MRCPRCGEALWTGDCMVALTHFETGRTECESPKTDEAK